MFFKKYLMDGISIQLKTRASIFKPKESIFKVVFARYFLDISWKFVSCLFVADEANKINSTKSNHLHTDLTVALWFHQHPDLEIDISESAKRFRTRAHTDRKTLRF